MIDRFPYAFLSSFVEEEEGDDKKPPVNERTIPGLFLCFFFSSALYIWSDL